MRVFATSTDITYAVLHVADASWDRNTRMVVTCWEINLVACLIKPPRERHR